VTLVGGESLIHFLDDPPRFLPFLSVSTFRRGLCERLRTYESEREERLLAKVPGRHRISVARELGWPVVPAKVL
jgi:hypothetical protein